MWTRGFCCPIEKPLTIHEQRMPFYIRNILRVKCPHR